MWLTRSVPSTEVVLAGLREPGFTRLRLDRFPRGIDNFHIDVALGRVLDKVVTAYAGALVRDNMHRLWGQKSAPIGDSLNKAFGGILRDLHLIVANEAQASNRPERVQLFQFAVVKLMLNRIDGELAALRAELEDAMHVPVRQLSGQTLQYHQRAVTLARHAGHVRYLTARHLVEELLRVENSSLKSLRRSLLGMEWPVPEAMLGNPLLQLDGVVGQREFARLYPYLLVDEEMAQRLDRALLETFGGLLPDHVPAASRTPPQTGLGPGMAAQRPGGRGFLALERRVHRVFGQRELDDCVGSWLDVPDNGVALLGGDDNDWPRRGNWYHPRIGVLQKRLNRGFAVGLEKAGLMASVRASYELAVIYPMFRLVDAEQLVFDYLRGRIGRRDMARRLAGQEGVGDADALVRKLTEQQREAQRRPPLQRQQMMARLAGDYLRFRRDIKLAWRAFLAMDSIRLVVDEAEAELSRGNNTLQVFCREDVAEDQRSNVLGHAIISVDVRGVAELIEQVRRRNLSAAEHFSRLFYDPLNRLLDRFGASKIAVEGDALVLSILERGGNSSEHLSVARGCSLAAAILAQTAEMNRENAREELPPIELGLGVAYANEPPTYLYDHVRKVTVSPVTGVAKRLAGCHEPLRHSCLQQVGQGVFLVQPVQRGASSVHSEDPLESCNINGIYLDAAAFAQLNAEISLRQAVLRDKDGKRRVVLHVGHCADLHGGSLWLVVREHRARLWIGQRLLEPQQPGPLYYEVVSDPQMIARVRAHIERQPEPAGNTAPESRHKASQPPIIF